MERLTEHSKQTSHENGICCTHFRGPECLEVGGNCAMNCKWEEAAWSRLAAYEDTRLTPEEVLPKDKADEIALKLMRLADLESLRLIDADALMDVIRQHEYRLATKQGSIDYGMFTLGIQQAVDEQPTIDAVEVVRCRDCKHRYSDSWCEYVDDDDNFYCARGERKEGADNG